MTSFDHIDAASQMREIIRTAAGQIVQQQAPKPNIARVISVNFASLTASVWYPGTDAPVTVNLFPNSLPAAWQEQISADGSAAEVSSSVVGYGSIVAVENLNGKSYITSVLTGGILQFDPALLNARIAAQEATEIAADLAGQPKALPGKPTEAFINYHISDPNLTIGGSIDFGPFTNITPGTMPNGYIEVTVQLAVGAAKTYKFTVNPNLDFNHPGAPGGQAAAYDAWFRVLPEHSITENGFVTYDFDLDVTLKQTAYGNTDNFANYPELWFRIVKQSSTYTGLDANVTIRSNFLQRGRSLGGRQLAMQQTRGSGPFIKGYLGFHNAGMLWIDKDNATVFDNFGRFTQSGWGLTDSAPGTGWAVLEGVASTFSTNLNSGAINNPSNTRSTIGIPFGTGTAIDIYNFTYAVSINALPTGAELQLGSHVRYNTGTNTRYTFKVVINTNQTVFLNIQKTLTGTTTDVVSNFTVPGLTYNAFDTLIVRFKCFGTSLAMKVWKDGTQEPEAWHITATDSNITTGGAVTLFSQPGGANTNTKPYLTLFLWMYTQVQAESVRNDTIQWHTGPYRSGLLRQANDVQKTWTHDGTFEWDGSHIKWSGTIYLAGIGRHRNGIQNGRMDIAYPDGAFIQVWQDNRSEWVGPSGLLLGPGHSLWYALQPGTGWTEKQDTDPYFFIVDSEKNLYDFCIPEWAVLIAVRPPEPTGNNPTRYGIRLGNGETLDAWRSVTPNAGWTNRGSGFTVLGFKMINQDTMILGGECTGNPVTTPQLATLPAGYRPDVQWNVPIRVGATTRAFLNVQTTGIMTVVDSVNASNLHQLVPTVITLNTVY